jgi:1-acyl-sn-glycerol-3-phosphate acyltransferase
MGSPISAGEEERMEDIGIKEQGVTGRNCSEVLRYLVLAPSALGVLCLTALFVAVFQTLTFFKLRNVCCEYITRPCCRILLGMFGFTYEVHNEDLLSNSQKIYIFNHTTFLDTALLPAICFKNTRYFMSKSTYKYIPITIINIFIGTFLIDEQDKPAKRTGCFTRAERILRKTGDSVLLSPGGPIVTTGRIPKFNKGAFHLATNMKVPIVPVYFYIPPVINPGRGYRSSGGHVEIHILPEVNTSTWVLDDLDKNRKTVRDLLVDYNNRMHNVSHE